MRWILASIVFHVLENWFFFAIITSIIWGLRAAKYPPERPKKPSKGPFWDFIRVPYTEFFFHFACSFAGWVFLHMVYVRYVYAGKMFGFIDIVMVLLAVIGMSGQLPRLIPQSFRGRS